MHITENATGGSATKQLKVCFAITCGGGLAVVAPPVNIVIVAEATAKQFKQ
jgi:hypothetical protein